MPNSPPRKRPCSICRKWFLPDVRQKGRQVTCSPECQKERHRRQCAKWNRKNRADRKSDYLSKKLEQTAEPPLMVSPPGSNKGASVTGSRINLHLPRGVLRNELGEKNLIIIDYLIEQILARVRLDSGLLPVKNGCRPVDRGGDPESVPEVFLRHIRNITDCNKTKYQQSNPFGFSRRIRHITSCK
jgi:hypothetical protein